MLTQNHDLAFLDCVVMYTVIVAMMMMAVMVILVIMIMSKYNASRSDGCHDGGCGKQ